MIEKFTIHELEAALQGRAKPGNLRGGETIAQYVFREVQELAAERDRAVESYQGLMEDGGHLL